VFKMRLNMYLWMYILSIHALSPQNITQYHISQACDDIRLKKWRLKCDIEIFLASVHTQKHKHTHAHINKILKF
jgi:hypothetical protein